MEKCCRTVISSSNAVINLAAGKYTLTITDDKECSFTDEFEVLEKENSSHHKIRNQWK